MTKDTKEIIKEVIVETLEKILKLEDNKGNLHYEKCKIFNKGRLEGKDLYEYEQLKEKRKELEATIKNMEAKKRYLEKEIGEQYAHDLEFQARYGIKRYSFVPLKEGK